METKIKIKPALQADWYRVTITGLAEGEPVLLGFYTTLTLRNGANCRCAQTVCVLDEHLLNRLRNEVNTGDEISVYTEVDPSTPDSPTILKDYCLA